MSDIAIAEKHLSPRIIGLTEVKARTNYSRSKIYRLIGEGKFPSQANKLDGSTSAGWFEDQIDAYLEARRPQPIAALCQDRPDHLSEAPVVRKLSKGGGSGPGSLEAPAMIGPKGDVIPKWRDTSLVSIGKNCEGSELFLHKPSRQLLVVVGTASAELLRKLG